MHKADTEAYKKAHGWKMCAVATVPETHAEVSKDGLSKLTDDLVKDTQEIRKSLA